MSLAALTTLIATTLTGLNAGLFFAFSVAVMPGLRRVDDETFVATMNAINRAILNPVFGIVFAGALLAPLGATIVAFVGGETVSGWVLAASTLVGVIGVFAVTGAVNVPLNEALARDHDRQRFESRWVRFTTVRTVASTASFILAAVALVV